MSDDMVKMGRLALRHEGSMWNAYYALPDTMDGAVFLGSIQIAFVQNEARKKAFMALMQEAVGDILGETIGARLTWPGPQPGPEHERPRKPRASDLVLAGALQAAGLEPLAARAHAGEFNEFFGPHATPELILAAELACIATPAAMAVRQRLINGDFDAGSEESEEWSQSPEGQDVMRRLVRGD
jgi:hypothetical protein